MVASRDIPAGEVIFVESPLTFGPSEVSKPICLGCYDRIRAFSYACAKCGFPMCGSACQEIKEHADNECAAFQAKGFKYYNKGTFIKNLKGKARETSHGIRFVFK